jgi:hypothetical protein
MIRVASAPIPFLNKFAYIIRLPQAKAAQGAVCR